MKSRRLIEKKKSPGLPGILGGLSRGLKEYKEQAVCEFWAPGLTYKMAGSSSLMALTYQISLGALTNQTQLASVFKQYRILKAIATLIPISSDPGSSVFWFDDLSTSAPTSSEALTRTAVLRSNNSAALPPSGSYKYVWRPKEISALQFLPTSSPVIVTTLKGYSDSANFGAGTTPTWFVRVKLLMQFRELA